MVVYEMYTNRTILTVAKHEILLVGELNALWETLKPISLFFDRTSRQIYWFQSFFIDAITDF